ncbi:MAG: peptide deformylase [Patescibacteria group bacterium]|nr:peptide deformylase [Patescibacteria group bacterium]
MILNIKKYPDSILRKEAKEVEKVDDNIKNLILDMTETMQKYNGAGLAAPQVGVSKRIIIANDGNEDLAIINPKIVKKSWRKQKDKEGCLSLPGLEVEINRSKKIIASGISYSGKKIRIEAKDLMARILQHEIDHLNGILIIDRLNEKQKKEYEKTL